MSKDIAKRFVDFINQTGSPYHSVLACKNSLKSAGFQPLTEKAAEWNIMPGVGKKADVNSPNTGVVMIGAHTDSPCLQLRPHSAQTREKCLQLGVSTYGGGLWHTWFDRGLGLAGKVVYRETSGSLNEKLIRISKPVCIVPNLAIHLQSSDERKGFDPNTENHLMPVIATNRRVKDEPSINGHHKALLGLIAQEAGCSDPAQITDLSVCLMDAQPAEFVGVDEEFVSTGRIDNQLSTWAAIDALASGDLCDTDICIAAAFNHEEVGSNSSTGADSQTAVNWVHKILRSLGSSDHDSILSRSVLVSADCAHAIHPNYAAKHQAEHKVYMQGGIVFKMNPNQRYSTTCVTSAMAREVCKRANVEVQDFVVRNDSPCGSTIGPMLSALLGVRAIDLGAPQWAMHSCRETCGVDDIDNLRKACTAFYQLWRTVDNGYTAAEDIY